jgi:membrane-bound metal-dependent hydrolase YbcI (DUF457 family)
MALTAALIAASNLPDLDFAGRLFGAATTSVHQAGTHSFAFVLAAALALAWALRGVLPYWQAWRWLAAAGVAHLLLDLVTHDALAPIGIPLAWPISDVRWHSPVDLFPGTDRSRLFSLRNLYELLAELAWTLPVLALLLRRRFAGIPRPGAACQPSGGAGRRTDP